MNNNPNYAQNNPEMRAQNSGRGELEIDIWAVVRSVLSRWWLILMVGVALAAITFVVYQAVHVDTYTATGSIYLVTNVSESQSQQSGATISDAKYADTFMNDYLEDLNDRSNFSAALASLNDEMFAAYDKTALSESQIEELKKSIASRTSDLTVDSLKNASKLWNEKDTHFIYVSVTSSDMKLAYAGSTSLLNSSVERLKDFYGVEQVSVRRWPDQELKKDSSGLIRYTVIAGLAGVLIVIAILAFLYIRDDKVNTADDVEQHLGLTVLAMIPLYNPDDAGESRDNG